MVKKGEVLSTLPDAPLPLEIVRDLNSNDQILLAKPLPDATAGIDEDDPADVDGADEETTRRIAVQTPMGGYLVEYLPPDGWVVIRSVTPEEWSEDEIADMLLEMAAETPSAEYLADLMQTGYDLLNDHNTVAACKRWLEVWAALKHRFTPEMTSISDAERVFAGPERLYNWCQDFEMHLGNAEHEDAVFHERRIEYCREFCELFPDSNQLIIQNMRSATAVSLFALGAVENRVDAAVGDRDVVSGPQHVRNRDCASVSALVQRKHPVFEIGRILCVGVAARRVQLWNLTALAVLFGELLHPSTTDFELGSDQGGIHPVINNPLTDPGDIVLVKLHFT